MKIYDIVRNKLGFSRRKILDFVKSGRLKIFLDGNKINEINKDIKNNQTLEINFDGENIKLGQVVSKKNKKLLIMFNKPKGYVVSKSDKFNKTIYDILPDKFKNYFYVGRLDKDSQGLLFLTNDGELANKLSHPSFGKIKVYKVVIKGKFTESCKKKFLKGLHIDGEILKMKKIRVLKSGNNRTELEIILTYGKNRQIRKMMESCGYEVIKLKRIQFGIYKLGNLSEGKWRYVKVID